MKYRHLSKQGLRVSELALGSWMTDVSEPDKQELAAQSINLALISLTVPMHTVAGLPNDFSAKRFNNSLAKSLSYPVKSFSQPVRESTIVGYPESTLWNQLTHR